MLKNTLRQKEDWKLFILSELALRQFLFKAALEDELQSLKEFRKPNALSKLFFSLFGESFMWMLLFLWQGKGVFISLFAFFLLPLVFGKRYRFAKLAAVARCDIPAVFPQVWASSFLPNEPALAERCQREYKQQHGEPMLLQYARMEAQAQVTQHR